jgi:hypothetical protein
MSNPDVNIDEIQSQINQAETYLSNASLEIRRSLRNSKQYEEIPKFFEEMQSFDTEMKINKFVQNTQGSVSLDSRSLAQTDREALIQRLLNDHKRRKEQRKELEQEATQFRLSQTLPDKKGAPLSNQEIGSGENIHSTISFEAQSPTLLHFLRDQDNPEEPVDISEYYRPTLSSSSTKKSPSTDHIEEDMEFVEVRSKDSLDESMELRDTVKFTRSLQTWEKNDLHYEKQQPHHRSVNERVSALSKYNEEEYEEQEEEEGQQQQQQHRDRYARYNTNTNSGNLPKEMNSTQILSTTNTSQTTITNNTTRPPLYQQRQSTSGSRSISPSYRQLSADQQHHTYESLAESKRQNQQQSSTPNYYRRNSKEELTKLAEEEFKRTYTFTPNLVTSQSKPQHQQPPFTFQQQQSQNQQQPSSSLEIKKQQKQRFQQLHDQYAKQLKERERLKQEFEKLDMLECTFHPDTSKTSHSTSTPHIIQYDDHPSYNNQHHHNKHGSYFDRRSTSPYPPAPPRSYNASTSAAATLSSTDHYFEETKPASERLYEEAQERSKKLHYLSEQLEEMKMSEYTFQPSLNPYDPYRKKKEIDTIPPIHERLADVQKQRQRHLHALRESYEKKQAEAFTFQPKIDTSSKKIAEEKQVKSWLNQQYYSLPDEAYQDLQQYEQESHPYPSYLQHTSRRGRRGRSVSASPPPPPPPSSTTNVSGYQEAYSILAKDHDIGKRLLAEGRKLNQRKQQLLFAREQELSELMEPPKMNDKSKKILEQSDIAK